MPIENRVGNLFEQPDVNVIAHQCNLFHTFGAGIAKVIKDNYPQAYEADCKTVHGDESKLGNFSYARSGRLLFLNIYSQSGLGGGIRQTSYDAIVDAFTKIESDLRLSNDTKKKAGKTDEFIVGIPYKYGCGLARGDWRIVRAIFESIFKDSSVKLVIVRLPSESEVD